jgi:hypothetical protein
VNVDYISEKATVDKALKDAHKRCPRTVVTTVCNDLAKFKEYGPQLTTEALDAIYSGTNIPNASLLTILKMFSDAVAKATSMGLDLKTLNSEAVRALGQALSRNERAQDLYNTTVMQFQGGTLPPLNGDFPAHIAVLIARIQEHAFLTPSIERAPSSEVHPHTVDVNFTQPRVSRDRPRPQRLQEDRARRDRRDFRQRPQHPVRSPYRPQAHRVKQVGAPMGTPATDHHAPGTPADPPPAAHVGRREFRGPAPRRDFRASRTFGDFPRRGGRGPHGGGRDEPARTRRFNSKSFQFVSKKRYLYFNSSSSSSSYTPTHTPTHRAIQANLTVVYANQAQYVEPILQGVLDSGATRTVTPLLDEMTDTVEDSVSTQGYGSEHTNSATKTGVLRGIPAVYDPSARQTLYAPRDIMRVQHSCMVYTTGSLFVVDEQDCKAWLEKSEKFKKSPPRSTCR